MIHSVTETKVLDGRQPIMAELMIWLVNMCRTLKI